ncbi:MAG: Ig-like domain repeat protein [Abditibacteriales bacterium]|nr:Ig-like domain repeat protein [Abditibacteriales bacterium]
MSCDRQIVFAVALLLTAMLLFGALSSYPSDTAFGASDQSPPVLMNPQTQPSLLSFKGGNVTLRATAEDDEGVTSAQAEVAYPDRRQVRVNLTLKVGSVTSGVWEGTFTAPMNPTQEDVVYEVTFFAKDAAGNEGTLTGTTFVVAAVDIMPPSLSSPQADPPRLTPLGGNVRLSVIVTDDEGVASVQAKITKPDGNRTTIDLMMTMVSDATTGGLWEGTFTAPMNKGKTDQTYKVTFTAKDSAGNQATSEEITFTVAAMVEIKPPGPIPVSTD